MDIQAITQVISNVGFPIAMCIMMFYRLQKSDETHKEEMEKLRDSFDGNTKAINGLTVELAKKEINIS